MRSCGAEAELRTEVPEPRELWELAMMWFWYIICCSRAGKGRAAMPVAPKAIAAAVAL